jgi:aspartyl-tRNA(Asn)/glutamyl-tRNA(Gln) amidotransferase subunit A
VWKPLRAEAAGQPKEFKIGLPKEYFEHDTDESVKKAFEATRDQLKKMGATFVDVSLPHTAYSVPVYYMVATSEASSNLSRYDGVRYGFRAEAPQKEWGTLDDLYSFTRSQGFGTEVKRRILLGTFALSSGYYDAYYAQASKVRRLIQNDFLEAFKKCDVILGPVTTSPAFKTGTRINDPVQMYLNDIFTTSVNLAGLPGMTVPVSVNADGLPLGVQIIAPHFAEQPMMSLARAIESFSDMKGKHAHGLQ